MKKKIGKDLGVEGGDLFAMIRAKQQNRSVGGAAWLSRGGGGWWRLPGLVARLAAGEARCLLLRGWHARTHTLLALSVQGGGSGLFPGRPCGQVHGHGAGQGQGQGQG